MSDAATALAELAESVRTEPGESSVFFGVVVLATTTTVMVRADSMDAGYIGPIPLVGTLPPVANDRVCCISAPGGGIACLGKVVT